MLRTLSLLLSVLTMFAGPGFCQPGAPSGVTIEAGPTHFAYTFAEAGVSITDLIRAASAATGRPILFSGELERRPPNVRMEGTVRVAREDVWSFWQSVMAANGFAIINLGGDKSHVAQLEQVDTSRLLKQNAEFVPVQDLEALKGEAGRIIVTTIPLRFTPVANVRQAVTQVLQNRQAEFTQEIASANQLIVMGFAPTVYSIYQLIRMMDVPPGVDERRVERFQLRYALAAEAAPIAARLLGISSGAPNRGQSFPPAFGEAETILVVDSRTNSLIMRGTKEMIEAAKGVIVALDVEVEEASPKGTPGEERKAPRVDPGKESKESGEESADR